MNPLTNPSGGPNAAPNPVGVVPGAQTATLPGFNATTLPNGAPVTPITGTLPALDTSGFKNAFDAMNAQKVAAQSSAGPVNMDIAQANANVNQANYNLQANRLQALANISNQLAAASPSNFSKKASPDGGYNFFDGSGKPISLSQYIQATGNDPATVLKGSTNPGDINYVNDHTVLEKVGQFLLSGDLSGLQKYDKTNFNGRLLPTLKQNGITTTPGGYQQLAQAFMNHYSNVWNPGATNSSPTDVSLFTNTPGGSALGAEVANQQNAGQTIASLLGQ